MTTKSVFYGVVVTATGAALRASDAQRLQRALILGAGVLATLITMEPLRIKGQIVGAIQIGRLIGRIEKKRKIRNLLSRDLRRSFAARWVTCVNPQVHMVMMRHESIQPTLRYYAGLIAERTADAIWEAFANKSANTK